MNIRSKIILITLPLIIAPLILTLIVSNLSAKNGITVVATEFLTFKSQVLTNYMESQWKLLVINNLEDNQEFLDITKSTIEGFSKTLIGSDEEKIFAIDFSGQLTMMSSEIFTSDLLPVMASE